MFCRRNLIFLFNVHEQEQQWPLGSRAHQQYFNCINWIVTTYIIAGVFWIGAFDYHGNDTFYWLDGTSVDSGYTNYDTLTGGNNDALATDDGFNWEWNDYIETGLYASLCEKDIW